MWAFNRTDAYNPSDNILAIYCVSEQSDLPQIKRELISVMHCAIW